MATVEQQDLVHVMCYGCGHNYMWMECAVPGMIYEEMLRRANEGKCGNRELRQQEDFVDDTIPQF